MPERAPVYYISTMFVIRDSNDDNDDGGGVSTVGAFIQCPRYGAFLDVAVFHSLSHVRAPNGAPFLSLCAPAQEWREFDVDYARGLVDCGDSTCGLHHPPHCSCPVTTREQCDGGITVKISADVHISTSARETSAHMRRMWMCMNVYPFNLTTEEPQTVMASAEVTLIDLELGIKPLLLPWLPVTGVAEMVLSYLGITLPHLSKVMLTGFSECTVASAPSDPERCYLTRAFHG